MENLITMFRLVKKSWKPLLIFEILYQTIGIILVNGFIFFIYEFCKKLLNVAYITNDNILEIIQNPIAIIFILIIFFIITIYFVLEIVVILLIFDKTKNGQIIDRNILKEAYKKILNLIKTKKIGIMILSSLIIPLTNIFMVSNYINKIQIPNFILDEINDNIEIKVSLILVYIGLITITFFGIFIFHNLIIKNQNIRQSVKNSIKLLKRRKLKTLSLIIITKISVIISIYLIILIINLGIDNVCIFLKNNNLNEIYLYLLSIKQFIIQITELIGGSFEGIITYGMISCLFYKYNNEKIVNKLEEQIIIYKERKFLKVIKIVSTVVIISYSFYYITFYKYQYQAEKDKEIVPKVQITAHRGGKGIAPENTIPAFLKSIEQKVDFVELDVRLTKDNELVVFHDENAKRVTGKNRKIKDMTLEEIKSLDAGSFFSKEYEGTQIPTLEEVVNVCKDKVKLNIEIKKQNKNENIEEKVINIVKKYNIQNQCVITCLNYEVLQNIKKLDNSIKVGYLVAMGEGEFYNLDVDFFGLETSLVNENIINLIHNKGKKVVAWTVNKQDDMQYMINLGVDNIITNIPQVLRDNIVLASKLKK